MSDDTQIDRVVRVIEAAHQRLAAFARESYQADGRGVIRVSLPAVPAGGTTGVESTEMVYHTLDEIVELIGDMHGTPREDAGVLAHMIETYDPLRQAVVTAAFEGQNPISIKMKLEPPFLVAEAAGVH